MTPPTLSVTLPIPPAADPTKRSGAERGKAERDWNHRAAWHCMEQNATSRIGGPYALRLLLHRMPIEPHSLLRAAVIGLRRAGVLPGNQRARWITIAVEPTLAAGDMRAEVWALGAER